MAEEQHAQEKTEQPTSKRLKDARKKGQVARSKDLNATIILLASGMGMLLLGRTMAERMGALMTETFKFTLQDLLNNDFIIKSLVEVGKYGLYSMIPLLLIIVIASLLAPISLGGWSFSASGMMPKFSRMNPLKGLKRMVSVKGFVEMLKSLAKFIVVASCGIIVIKIELVQILNLGYLPMHVAISKGLWILMWSFITISSALILISLIDVPFQLHQHNQQLKMTKQEVKDEYKETEGKPEVKSNIRRAQQEIAKRRMIQEVPKADVILTNPSHYAVALSYDEKGVNAPVVIAKGQDFIAQQINKVATAHQIPVLRIPLLTRAIYFSTKLNKEIPQGLYVAVAQVLAFIFQLRRAKHHQEAGTFVWEQQDLPLQLHDLPIPKEYRTEGEQ